MIQLYILLLWLWVYPSGLNILLHIWMRRTPLDVFLIYAGRFIAVNDYNWLLSIYLFLYFLQLMKTCVYHDLPIRDIMLVCQILMLLIISVYAFSSMIRLSKTEEKHTRYRILASFGFIMAHALFVQLWFPYLPIYSIAYMLGTCLLHSFVANDEKEEL